MDNVDSGNIFVPKDILQKIATENPTRETSMLTTITSSSLSVDEAIKRLEPNASLSYIANKLSSLQDKKRMIGMKKLIDTYVSLCSDYDKYAVEIDEIMDLVVGERSSITVSISENNDVFDIYIYTDPEIVSEEKVRQVFEKYGVEVELDVNQNNGRYGFEIVGHPQRDGLHLTVLPIMKTLKKYITMKYDL